MSKRLNQDREKKLQPERIEYAKNEIQKRGFTIHYEDEKEIRFAYGGHEIKVFPYSGYFTGKGIKDGRGLKNLLSQLENN